MILTLFLLLAAPQDRPEAAPVVQSAPYRPAPATIVAEPIALFVAAADRVRDGRTTRPEFRQAILETTSADPAWGRGEGIGYIAYSDWAERWLGDRNALPTPFELDRNGDNRITFDEFSARMEAIFTRLDVNKDDSVTRAELLTLRNAALGRPDGEPRRKR